MRTTPIRRSTASLRRDSRLSATILRMIALNSLAAFTQDIGRTAGPGAVTPVRAAGGGVVAAEAPGPAQRKLEAVPAQPATILPRGSLLDLRV
ncbi:hypothetical protein [Roseomonas sp. BN140053]|uniref:hypothetical protein n=1 Tax=Roseomonas sp. BN140053 TaxID=3391898 RepID=UPI0039ECB947